MFHRFIRRSNNFIESLRMTCRVMERGGKAESECIRSSYEKSEEGETGFHTAVRVTGAVRCVMKGRSGGLLDVAVGIC